MILAEIGTVASTYWYSSNQDFGRPKSSQTFAGITHNKLED